MSSTTTRRRAEERIPQRVFVRLYRAGADDFQMAQTIDVSPHGARVATRKFVPPNEHLMVRSLRGNLTSYARVVHCESFKGDFYALGLELYDPIGEWNAPAAGSTLKL